MKKIESQFKEITNSIERLLIIKILWFMNIIFLVIIGIKYNFYYIYSIIFHQKFPEPLHKWNILDKIVSISSFVEITIYVALIGSFIISILYLYIITIKTIIKIDSINYEYNYVHQSTGKILLLTGLSFPLLIILGAFMLDKQLKIALEQSKIKKNFMTNRKCFTKRKTKKQLCLCRKSW